MKSSSAYVIEMYEVDTEGKKPCVLWVHLQKTILHTAWPVSGPSPPPPHQQSMWTYWNRPYDIKLTINPSVCCSDRRGKGMPMSIPSFSFPPAVSHMELCFISRETYNWQLLQEKYNRHRPKLSWNKKFSRKCDPCALTNTKTNSLRFFFFLNFLWYRDM